MPCGTCVTAQLTVSPSGSLLAALSEALAPVGPMLHELLQGAAGGGASRTSSATTTITTTAELETWRAGEVARLVHSLDALDSSAGRPGRRWGCMAVHGLHAV